jgi:DNA-binding NarL/FixJ family response regulator
MSETGARLSQGPPKLVTDVKFTPRELEYLDLRYQQELYVKEIADKMNVSERMVKYYSMRVYLKIGILSMVGDNAHRAIVTTKILAKNGFIKL